MYNSSSNVTKHTNLGMMPAVNPGRKRIREALLPPNEMLPNHFPPPPIPLPPVVRLGFNAYEQQQITQKRVRFNNDPHTPSFDPMYSYGNIFPRPDSYQPDYYNQNFPLQQESYQQQQQQPQSFFAYQQPIAAQYPVPSMPHAHSIAPQCSAIPQSSNDACSSSYPHSSMHYFGYKQIKENSDPNIPARLTTSPPPPLYNSTRSNEPPPPPPAETRESRDHQLSRGLQLITVSPEAISRWVPLLESFNIIFEIFANCSRLPSPFYLSGEERDQSPAKMFYLANPHSKQPSEQLKCVYWELDTPLLSIQLDRVYRIIGSFDVRNSFLKVFDVRAARLDEITNWPALVARSNRLIKQMPFTHNEI